jgi:hypothetical protein
VPVAAIPAAGQAPAKEIVRVTTTERLEFGNRGQIQILESFGEVRVEGWDKPEVELTILKSTQKKYLPKDRAKGLKELDRIRITMERVGESELLLIHTTFPRRTPMRMLRGKTNAQLEYTIRVPRTCGLRVKHDVGEVAITNMDGDIEATSDIGEIRLELPEANQYAVDARAKIGDVSSEFGPETSRRMASASLRRESAAAARRLFLRVGIGDIQVTKRKADPKSPSQNDAN